MKKILIAILSIGLIGVGIGLYLFNKPLESTKSMKAHFNMAASELLSAFESDENTANEKYLDKVIEVRGQVQKMDTKNGKTTIYLEANNPMSNIIFQLEQSNSKIEIGEHITLKGICTGYLMDVVLVRGVKI